ncbi:MAG: hypothetical protein ACLFOY_03240 [Desulfatibacillaceae bacterium]
MSFADQLQTKVRVDSLADNVRDSLGTPGSGSKIDRESMRHLLDMLPYEHKREREMDLYVWPNAPEGMRVLVLDNELPQYNTDMDDVLLRKNPTLKEMISIRNAKRILSDRDVALTKGDDTVTDVRRMCLEDLDLSFDEADVREIGDRLVSALKSRTPKKVRAAMELFAELLDYRTPDRDVDVAGARLWARPHQREGDSWPHGPIVAYARTENHMVWVDGPLDLRDDDHRQHLGEIIEGEQHGDAEGTDVADRLVAAVVDKWDLSGGRTATLPKG